MQLFALHSQKQNPGLVSVNKVLDDKLRKYEDLQWGVISVDGNEKVSFS